jgi:hypothetical protein
MAFRFEAVYTLQFVQLGLEFFPVFHKVQEANQLYLGAAWRAGGFQTTVVYYRTGPTSPWADRQPFIFAPPSFEREMRGPL